MDYQASQSNKHDDILKLLEKFYSYKNFEDILQAVADGITVQDPQGNICYANSAAGKVLGFNSIDELLQTPTLRIVENFELFNEAGEPISPNLLPGRLALLGEQSASLIVKWLRKDTKTYRWAEVKAAPIMENGKVILAVKDRKSTRLNSSHQIISYAVFCLKKKKKNNRSSQSTTSRELILSTA